mmetsp:Transcript_9339/g.10564  ORF Transcript_9339/g.10564 Transcript_9339/m.10564 type:complete len:84 (-) Transcript_9339:140-391(-)
MPCQFLNKNRFLLTKNDFIYAKQIPFIHMSNFNQIGESKKEEETTSSENNNYNNGSIDLFQVPVENNIEKIKNKRRRMQRYTC